jgi:hypothetical protein
MESKNINRLKVVLAEKKRTNKILVKQLGKNSATILMRRTNMAQSSLKKLIQISRCLDLNMKELVCID